MSKIHTKKLCFADKNGDCSALKVKDCKGCKFYKTKEEVARGRKKVLIRIQSLDENTKNHIIDKYFDKVGV